ncbi:uncharacterized protein DS421_12g371870 [Arachis hypogaea]|nr:uncharacterized protein DS421_12g371870 [Arachis hypogaea]
MSRRRLFTPVLNESCSESRSSISKRKQDKIFDGRCFCGLDATLLQSGTSINPGRWFIRCLQWKTEATLCG